MNVSDLSHTNQVANLPLLDLFNTDLTLNETVSYFTGSAYHDSLHQYVASLSCHKVYKWAEQANRHVPELHSWSAQGQPVNRVEFHPAWHSLMGLAVSNGLHCSAWSGQANSHLLRAARFYMHGQVEAGTLCPLTMTSASVPLLQGTPSLAYVLDKVQSDQYDESDQPITHKTSAIIGMGLTEKQGGSDLRNICTYAIRTNQRHFLLTGHKWFYSVPNADAHLVLAKLDHGMSCFMVPRWHDNGASNSIRILRLKDKAGNRSNASAEVEFENAYGYLVGEAGRGLQLLLQMAAYTRLDCVLGSAALLRAALMQAMHYARNRNVFGKNLIKQPLMRTVLVDLALESEAATMLALHLAAAMDHNTPLDFAFKRILTPAAKFWVCKRAIAAVAECMEVAGGNGYIETSPIARLYREAPVNSIWEGSGNVMCLDVLRAINKHIETAQILLEYLDEVCSKHTILQQPLQRLQVFLKQDEFTQQAGARNFVANLVRLVQACLLYKHSTAEVFQSFIETRFMHDQSVAGGAIVKYIQPIIDRSCNGL